jgi:hypothetical protein
MRPLYANNQLPTAPTQAVTGRHHRWYRGAIVRGRRKGFSVVPRRTRGALVRAHAAGRARALHAPATVAVLASALLLAGCGGGTRLDAAEHAATYTLKIVHASFPAAQSIARQTKFKLEVKNTGASTVPVVAVTIDAFDYTSNYAELAANKRPVWAIERGPGAIASPPVESQEVSVPGGAQTAYVNTWALGALAPGKTHTFVWRVVPVKSGSYTVHYSVVAGLSGKAKARLASGAPVQGQLAVDIAAAPKLTHVNPNTGSVEVGEFPATP